MKDQQWQVVRSAKPKRKDPSHTNEAATALPHSGAFHALTHDEDSSNVKSQEQRDKEKRKRIAAKERKKASKKAKASLQTWRAVSGRA